MFEQAKTFWRQILGRPGSAQALAESDERRDWARFRTDVPTTIKRSGAAESERQTARVRNVSIDGINLLVPTPYLPGEMLTIDVPAPNGQGRALACVVHCAEDDGGMWSLGCTFSRELGEERLATFDTGTEKPHMPEQRQWKRFECRIKATYQLIAKDDETKRAAQVVNLSANGVGLQVDREIETGSLLSVDLRKENEPGERTMLACVVHVTKDSDRQWTLGCNFIRSLCEEDLNALL